MKKIKVIIGVLLIGLFSGCDLKKENDNKINFNSQEYLQGYYQMNYSCAYQKEQLLYCDNNRPKYFMAINDKNVKIVKPLENNHLGMILYRYMINDNIINMKDTNSGDEIKLSYYVNKSIIDDNLIIEETVLNSQSVPLIFKSVYERISKEDYIRKTGATYEE